MADPLPVQQAQADPADPAEPELPRDAIPGADRGAWSGRSWSWPTRASAAVVAVALVAGAVGGFGADLLTRSVRDRSTTAVVAASSGALAALPAMVDQVSRSVVGIQVDSLTLDQFGDTATDQSAGSGFVLAADGLIATNAHVVGGAVGLTVTFADGSHEPAEIVGIDRDADLAVVRVARRDLVALDFARDLPVRPGDFVVAAGNALSLGASPTITVGIVSATDRTVTLGDGSELTHLLQTDAAISSGNSGGPLLSATGEVVGINTARASSNEHTRAENIGFAIPIERAAPVLHELAANAK